MDLQKMIASISPAMRKKAEALLNSDSFTSLVNEDGYCAAEFAEDGGYLIPEIFLDDNEVWEYECQCSKRRVVCVHITAVLIGIEKMLLTGCDDYREAVMLLERNAAQTQI